MASLDTITEYVILSLAFLLVGCFWSLSTLQPYLIVRTRTHTIQPFTSWWTRGVCVFLSSLFLRRLLGTFHSPGLWVFSLCFGRCLRAELLGHTVNLCLIFKNMPDCGFTISHSRWQQRRRIPVSAHPWLLLFCGIVLKPENTSSPTSLLSGVCGCICSSGYEVLSH